MGVTRRTVLKTKEPWTYVSLHLRLREAIRTHARFVERKDLVSAEVLSYASSAIEILNAALKRVFIRPKPILEAEMQSKEQELEALKNKRYKGSGASIPYHDWMQACDDDDYTSFWERGSDKRRMAQIQDDELPLLKQELEICDSRSVV